MLYDNPNPYLLGGAVGPTIIDKAVLNLIQSKYIGSIFANAPINAAELSNAGYGGDSYDTSQPGVARFFFAAYPKNQRYQYYAGNIPNNLIGEVSIPEGGELPKGATASGGQAQGDAGNYKVPSQSRLPQGRVVSVKINRNSKIQLKLTKKNWSGLISMGKIQDKNVSASVMSKIAMMDGEILTLMYASAFLGGELARFHNAGSSGTGADWKWLFADSVGHPYKTWYDTGTNKQTEYSALPDEISVGGKTYMLNKANFVAVEGDSTKKIDLIRGIGYTIIPQLNPFGLDNSDEWQTYRNSEGKILIPGLSEIQSKLVAQINYIQTYFTSEVMGVDLEQLGIIANIHFNNKLIKGGSWGDARYGDEKSNSYGGALAGVNYRIHPFLGTNIGDKYTEDIAFDFGALSAILYHKESACFLVNDVQTHIALDTDGRYLQFTSHIYYGYGALRPEMIRAVFHEEPKRRPTTFTQFDIAGGGKSPSDGATTYPKVKDHEDKTGPYPGQNSNGSAARREPDAIKPSGRQQNK